MQAIQLSQKIEVIRKRKVKELTQYDLIRLSELSYEKQVSAIYELVRRGYARNEEQLWQMVRACGDDFRLGQYNGKEPKPMSDDVLDRGIQYVSIAREIIDANT